MTAAREVAELTAVVAALALLVDLVAGDPPNRWHPVAWMGRALAAGTRRWCYGGPTRLVLAGGALVVVVTVLAGTAGWVVARLGEALGWPGILLEAVVLKATLALRGLGQAARGVADHLEAGDLARARAAVGRDLVSRPVEALDEASVASAAVESVAENLTDSVIAPLCWYAVFGLAGAFAYRALNTADAMLGYRTGALEHFGKLAARLDDAVSFVPARLAALGIVGAAWLGPWRGRAAWRTLRQDGRRTASPNAGLTMAAAAGALGVALAKPGHYVLGDGRPPAARDIRAATRLVTAVAALLAAGALAVAALGATGAALELGWLR